MKKSDIKMLEDFDNHLIEWTEEFEKMIIENICPKCEWEPDCGDYIISYGPKEYSYHLSLLSSFPQYVWAEVYECPNCNTVFKVEAESI